MNAPLANVLADLRAELERLYGPRLVRLVLFGSRARGDADDESDIDVMIILNGPVDHWTEIHRSGGVLADLCLRYNTLVSCVFCGKTEHETSGLPFYRNVRREGVAL